MRLAPHHPAPTVASARFSLPVLSGSSRLYCVNHCGGDILRFRLLPSVSLDDQRLACLSARRSLIRLLACAFVCSSQLSVTSSCFVPGRGSFCGQLMTSSRVRVARQAIRTLSMAKSEASSSGPGTGTALSQGGKEAARDGGGGLLRRRMAKKIRHWHK